MGGSIFFMVIGDNDGYEAISVPQNHIQPHSVPCLCYEMGFQ